MRLPSMSWNNNDGPWGPSNNKSSGNPFTRKPSGGNEPPNVPPPPDLNKFFQQLGESFRRWRNHVGGPQQLFVLGFSVLFAIWILSGFYQVGSNEAGVVMRFGAFDRVESAGLRYHLPYPIEDVLLPNVTSQNEIQIGFRRSGRTADRIVNLPEEAMMLTQDENIINVEFAVFWRVSDINRFLFEIRDPEQTVKMAAESAMREVIGQNKLQFALTDGRSQIADEARSRLQVLMDEYNAGVVITQINLQTVSVPDEVKSAFQDVVNARLDQERFQNEAETHANKVVPEAKGEASKITQQALAYRDQKIAIAQGDADRFKEVLIAYNQSRDVTTKRLYLETMEDILSNARKVIMDKSGSGAVSYLPLQEALKSKSEGASR
ncbi:MAG: FtsH protease activity modulator HflK [Alphaproteobacteria bacterium]